MNISDIHLTRSGPAQSPFLPGTNIQYAWDSTSLGYLKTCPRLYQYIMLEGWGSEEENVHLRFGTEFHQALEEYEKAKADGHKHEDAVRLVIRLLLERTVDFKPDESMRAGKYKNRNSLVRSVVWYLEHFKQDEAKTFILNNGKPAVELSFSFELEFGPSTLIAAPDDDGNDYGNDLIRQPYILSGHLDRVVEFSGDLYVMDHKTTTTTPGIYYFDSFRPNNQMTLYTLASQVILASPVKGVIINAVQLLVTETKFQRGTTYRTKDELDEWVQSLSYWLTLAESFANANYWPMNDTSCDKFGGCRFREICQKSPHVREKFLATKFKQLPLEDRWNPLRAR